MRIRDEVLREFTVMTRMPTDDYIVPHSRERAVLDVHAMADRIAQQEARIRELEAERAGVVRDARRWNEVLDGLTEAQDRGFGEVVLIYDDEEKAGHTVVDFINAIDRKALHKHVETEWDNPMTPEVDRG